MSAKRSEGSVFRAILLWFAIGSAIGSWIAVATIRMNGSILGTRDALVFLGWVALPYGALFAVAGSLAVMLARLSGHRALNASDHVAVALTAMLGFVLGSFALTSASAWATEIHLRTVLAGLACALIALSVATVRRARGAVPEAGRALLAPIVLSGLVAAPIVAVTVAPAGASTAPVPEVLVRPSEDGSARQVVLIGMDGADWEHLRPLALAGRLPNWKRLMDEGLVAPLTSEIPTWSPILWTTIATGRTGSEHGILDFTQLELPGLARGPQRMRVVPRLAQEPLPDGPPVPPFVGLAPLVDGLVQRGVLSETPMRAINRRVPALWNLLSDHGRSVATVRWWATWPPEEVAGWLVADDRPRKTALARRGGDTRAGGVTHPPAFLDSLAALEGPFWGEDGEPDPRTRLFGELDDDEFAALPDDLVERAWNGWRDDRFGIAAAKHLLASEDVDFLAVYTCSIDILGHLLEPWRKQDESYGVVLERAYEESDLLLGELLAERGPETTFVIVSDHGWSYASERYGHYHAPAGLFLMAGSGVDSAAALEREPSIFDVTPTILALLGLPASDEMPGRVLAEGLTAERAREAALPRIPSYGAHRPRWSIDAAVDQSGGGEEELERLRELGYVE